MENMIKQIGLCLMVLLGTISCSKEKLEVNYDADGPQFILPKGDPGSVDERIYNIHEKYGTYIFYEFEAKNFNFLWTGAWTRTYRPAVTSDNGKYIHRFLDKIESVILSKFEVEFVRRTLPYKIFLVDSLSKDYVDPTLGDGGSWVNMQSNGQNAFAIANVGKKSDTWGEKEWKKFDTDLNMLYTQNYYAALPTRPAKFISSRFAKTIVPTVTDPSGEDIQYFHSMRSVGYITGQLGTTSLAPKEDQDYAEFVAFLTSTPAKEMKRVIEKYPAMKTRSLSLVPYLNDVVGINVISTQNNNCPDDKLENDYFDKLQ